MRHAALGDDRAVEVAHDLMDPDGHASVLGRGESLGLDTRVDFLELPTPVFANRLAAVDAAALEGVGPVDVRVHVSQHGVDVAGVERGVEIAEERLVLGGHQPGKLAASSRPGQVRTPLGLRSGPPGGHRQSARWRPQASAALPGPTSGRAAAARTRRHRDDRAPDRRAGIDCDLRRRDHLTYALDDEQRERVRAEAEAAQALGLPAAFQESAGRRSPPPAPSASASRRSSIRGSSSSAARALRARGVEVFEHTPALSVSDGSPCRVRTPRGTLSARKVVVATHHPFLDRGLYFARMHPERSYSIAVSRSSRRRRPLEPGSPNARCAPSVDDVRADRRRRVGRGHGRLAARHDRSR